MKLRSGMGYGGRPNEHYDRALQLNHKREEVMK